MVDVEGAAARERPPEHDAKPGRLCLQPTGDRGFESCSLQQRVRLSQESIFAGQEPRLSARVCRAAFPVRSTESAGPANIAPTRSNISVGPYSSTAFPAMRSRQVVGLKSQLGAQTRSGFLGAQGCWWILRGRTGLKQSRARSADRASLVADVSVRAASAPSDRAVGAHRESLG